jgi:hypothetical protein
VFGGITPEEHPQLGSSAINTEGKARQAESVQQALRSRSTFLIRWHTYELRLQDCDCTGDPAHSPPGRLLAQPAPPPPTEAGNKELGVHHHKDREQDTLVSGLP